MEHSHPELEPGPISQEEGASVLLPMFFSLLPMPPTPTTPVIPLFNKYLFNTHSLPGPRPGPGALKRIKSSVCF